MTKTELASDSAHFILSLELERRHLATTLSYHHEFMNDRKLFQESENVEDVERERCREVVLYNRTISMREVSEEIRIPYRKCEEIFTYIFSTKQVTAKFVTKMLGFNGII